MIILADTNILLDVLANRQPFVEAAKAVWELSELHQVEGHVSSISFNNVYYIVRKSNGEAKARECLRRIRRVFAVAEVNALVIDQSIQAPITDFEDAIQYFSARQIGAQYLITRNPDDFPATSPIEILTPEVFVNQWRQQTKRLGQ